MFGFSKALAGEEHYSLLGEEGDERAGEMAYPASPRSPASPILPNFCISRAGHCWDVLLVLAMHSFS